MDLFMGLQSLLPRYWLLYCRLYLSMDSPSVPTFCLGRPWSTGSLAPTHGGAGTGSTVTGYTYGTNGPVRARGVPNLQYLRWVVGHGTSGQRVPRLLPIPSPTTVVSFVPKMLPPPLPILPMVQPHFRSLLHHPEFSALPLRYLLRTIACRHLPTKFIFFWRLLWVVLAGRARALAGVSMYEYVRVEVGVHVPALSLSSPLLSSPPLHSPLLSLLPGLLGWSVVSFFPPKPPIPPFGLQNTIISSSLPTLFASCTSSSSSFLGSRSQS